MPFQNNAIQAMFDHLLENKTPILFHCSAGKDRTGILAAIILLALYVDEEQVIKDYLLSNACRSESLDAFMERNHLTNKKIAQIAYDTVHVKEEYLQTALQAIQSKYSTYDEYLLKEYGLTKEKRKQLMELLLD